MSTTKIKVIGTGELDFVFCQFFLVFSTMKSTSFLKCNCT